MSAHTRWAVRSKYGLWCGANRGTFHHRDNHGNYVSRPGYNWTDRVEYARLFTRRGDAIKAARYWDAEVVPVTVSL